MNKAGNRWVRAVAIEGAWAWLRYQPHSALSEWYERRFAAGGVTAAAHWIRRPRAQAGDGV